MPKDCLADLVHEIRGPLAPIATGLEILRLEIDHPELLAVLDMMRRQLDQLVEILNARLRASDGSFTCDMSPDTLQLLLRSERVRSEAEDTVRRTRTALQALLTTAKENCRLRQESRIPLLDVLNKHQGTWSDLLEPTHE